MRTWPKSLRVLAFATLSAAGTISICDAASNMPRESVLHTAVGMPAVNAHTGRVQLVLSGMLVFVAATMLLRRHAH